MPGGLPAAPSPSRATPAAGPQFRDDLTPFEPRAERINTDPSHIKYPAFLPWYDFRQSTSETPEQRLTYRRMLADPYISAGFRSLILSVVATEFNFEPYRPRGCRTPSPRDAEISDFVEWALTQRPERGLGGLAWDVLAHGLIDGVSVVEPIRDLQCDGKWKNKDIITDTKPKDVDQDFYFRIDSHRNIIDMVGLRFNAGLVFNPDDFLIYSHMPLYGSPAGLSQFRSVYRAYWQLDTISRLRALAAEKRAIPIVAGKGPPGQQEFLEQAMRDLKSRQWMYLPPECEVTVLNIAASSEEIYKSALADLREEICMGLTNATLQLMVGKEGGQRGNSQVHKDQSNLVKWYLAHVFAQLLNSRHRGLIRKLVDWNYQGVMGYPQLTVGGVDSQDLKADLEIDQGLSKMGFMLSRHDMSERYGREEATDPADQLTPMVQNPGLPGDPNDPNAPGGGPQGGPPGPNDDSPLGRLIAGGFQDNEQPEQFAESITGGFTGTIKDKLGREYHYVNGKRVAQHEDSGPIHWKQADAIAAHPQHQGPEGWTAHKGSDIGAVLATVLPDVPAHQLAAIASLTEKFKTEKDVDKQTLLASHIQKTADELSVRASGSAKSTLQKIAKAAQETTGDKSVTTKLKKTAEKSSVATSSQKPESNNNPDGLSRLKAENDKAQADLAKFDWSGPNAKEQHADLQHKANAAYSAWKLADMDAKDNTKTPAQKAAEAYKPLEQTDRTPIRETAAVFAVTKKQFPDVTPEKFQKFIKDAWNKKIVEMHILNEVWKPEYQNNDDWKATTLQHNGQPYAYVQLKNPEALGKLAAKYFDGNDSGKHSEVSEAHADSSLHDAAQELGHEGGLKGGPARAAALSSSRRHSIAAKAATARWEQGGIPARERQRAKRKEQLKRRKAKRKERQAAARHAEGQANPAPVETPPKKPNEE